MAAGLGFKTFTTGEVLTAGDVNGYLMQGVLVFASTTARDAAITSPQEGQFAYLKDTNTTTYYTGSAWANLDTTGMVNPMTTTGDTIYSSSGSTPARLGIGSTGQVLTVAGGVPTWATISAGGMTLINTGGTSLSGSSTTISSIPSTYKSLYILVDAVRNTTNGTSASYRFNSDTGTKYVSREYYDTDAQPIQVSNGVQMYNNFSNASPYGTVVITIPNYTSTGYKLLTSISAADSSATAGYSYFYQRNRAYFGSGAINSITFYTSDSFAGGTVYVYGVN